MTFFSLFLFPSLDGSAGSGRVPGDGGSTAGGGFSGSSILPAVPGGDLFYIIGGIRSPRMPRRRVSWHSTVPWVSGGRRGGRPGALERLVRVASLMLEKLTTRSSYSSLLSLWRVCWMSASSTSVSFSIAGLSFT